MTRAQEAEEIFIVKKELAKMKRKLSEMEGARGQETSKDLAVGNKERNNEMVSIGRDEGSEGEQELGKDNSKSSPRMIRGRVSDVSISDRIAREGVVVKSPSHVCREEAEVCVCAYNSVYIIKHLYLKMGYEQMSWRSKVTNAPPLLPIASPEGVRDKDTWNQPLCLTREGPDSLLSSKPADTSDRERGGTRRLHRRL